MAESKLKEDLPCLFGLAFFCAMLRPPFFSSLITPEVPHASELRFFYDALIVTCGIAIFALCLKKKRDSFFTSKKFAWAGLLAFLGAVAMNIGRLALGCNLAFIAAGAALVAMGMCSLTVSWISHVARLDRFTVLPLFVAAFVASHVLGLLDLLPRDAESIAVSLYPALSSCLLAQSLSRGLIKTAIPAATDSDSHRYFLRLEWLAMTLVLVEMACGALLRASYTHGGIGYSPNSSTLLTYIGSALIGLIAYLIVRRRKYASENALIVGGVCLFPMLFAAIGVACFPATSFAPLVTGGYSMLLVLMMGLVTLWHQDNAVSTGACAGVAMFVYGVSIDVTFTILPRFFGAVGVASDDQVLYDAALGGLIIAIGVSLCLLMMVFLQRRDFLAATETVLIVPPAEKPSSLEDAVTQLAEQRQLTKRECEIAALIARGYTVKRIAEELVISTGTVQSHSKSIYRKLGIHRKDELIEIVEEQRARS